MNQYGILFFLFSFPIPVMSMQSLDDSQMSEVTGEGIGATFDNVAIYSGNYGMPDDFKLKLQLTEGVDPDYLIFSELRFNRSGVTKDQLGGPDTGGFFGTYENPLFLGDLREITESHLATFTDGSTGYKSFTALYTGFPAADLNQNERSFFRFAEGQRTYANTFNADGNAFSSHRDAPQGFFNNGSVNVGNYFTLADTHAAEQALFEAELDLATSKFDLHMRVDSVNDSNRLLSPDEQFLSYVDLKGVRLYGTETHIWAHDNQNETPVTSYINGEPIHATKGLAMAMTTGLRADEIILNTNLNNAAASALSLKGVDMYLPLGTVDQPLTISTVQFQQEARYTWGQNNFEPAKTQMRIEVAQLPQDVGQAAQGNIFIQSLGFGDENDEEIITGYEDIYLRERSGAVAYIAPGVAHRAFVPKTVIYNEQVDIFNQNNPDNPLPYIPNQNVIEIRGLEIQRMVITTQDL